MLEEIDTQDQKDNSKDHLRPWQFKPGQSGNPGGRPKGTISLKEYAKKYLQDLDEEGKLKFMEGIDKKTIWEMAESKPSQGIGQAEDLKELHINLIKFDDNSDTTPQPTT
jgi:hypothetical protein